MLFNSYQYIFLFLPIVVAIYFFLNKFRYVLAGKVWLVLMSLFFYGLWNFYYVLLIAFSISANYLFGGTPPSGITYIYKE